MRRSFPFRILGFAVLATPLFAAPAPFWRSVGPLGAVVQCLAVSPSNPQVVYAGVLDGGVFRSDDGGDVWRARRSGLGHFNVLSVAVSPSDSQRVLAGTLGGAFGSTDGGATWAATAGLAGVRVDAILFDPHSPQTVYAAGSDGNLAKSTDGGATWGSIGGAVAVLGPRVLAIHPTQTSTLYLGTPDDGVHRTDNGGASWRAVNSGLENLHVSALAIDPDSPETVLAGTQNGGVFRTQDGGTNWSELNTGLSLSAERVGALAAEASGAMFLGSNSTYRLAPGGTAWTQAAPFGLGPVNALALGPGAPGRLFVGYGNLSSFSSGGVAYSDDRAHFFRMREGLNALNVAALAVDPFDPSRVLVAFASGGAESDDGGASWTRTDFYPTGAPASLAFDLESAGVAYMGALAGVWKSIDGGRTWTAAAAGLPAVRALLPVTGSGGVVVAGTSVGVYRSADGGASWAAAAGIAEVPVYSLAPDAGSATTLWAGTEEGGVFRSIDAGLTWSQAGTVPGVVRALHSSAGSPAGLFAGTDSGLFVSTDGGAAWAPVGAGFPAAAVYALAADEVRSVLYAGTGAGVFQNVAGHWEPAAGASINPQVRALAVLGDGTLLAGMRGGSVYRRNEGAERDSLSRATERDVPRPLPPRTP